MRPNSSAPSSAVKDLEPNAKAMTAPAAQPLPPPPIAPTRWCGTWAGPFREAQDQHRCLQGALGRKLGRLAGELRRHRAQECGARSGALAEAAGQERKVSMSS